MVKKLLVAALALSALSAAAPAASATHAVHYRGGCSMTGANDTTPNQALGGPESWNGEIHLLAYSTDGGSWGAPLPADLYVRCDLYRNNVLIQLGALEASGYGVAANSARLQLAAATTDVVSLCEYVEVGGHAQPYSCSTATTTPIVPEPVRVLIEYLLANPVLPWLEPTICAITVPLAGQYGPVYIGSDGDIYLFGNTDAYRWWDCAPYGGVSRPWLDGHLVTAP